MSSEYPSTPTQHELSPSTTEFFRQLGSYTNAIAVKGYKTEAPGEPEEQMCDLHHATVRATTRIPQSDHSRITAVTPSGSVMHIATSTKLEAAYCSGDEIVVKDRPFLGQSTGPRYSIVTALTTR